MQVSIGGTNQTNNAFLKELSPGDNDVILSGYRTSILKWLYHHCNLPIKGSSKFDETDGSRHITIFIAQHASTGAAEYGKALGAGLAGEATGVLGIVASLADPANTAGLVPGPGTGLKGKPGKLRRGLDKVAGDKYNVYLRAMAQQHPNPHASLSTMSVPATVAHLIQKLESMSW